MEVLETRLLEDGQVVPVNDPTSGTSRYLDQRLKEFTEFRGPSRDVHDFWRVAFDPLKDAVSRRGIHHFTSPGCGIHMAMAAGLVALTPHIDLERFQGGSLKPFLVLLEFLIERVHAVDLLAGCPMHGML